MRDKLYPKYKITVSIGIADSGDDKDVVRKADDAMYKAKKKVKIEYAWSKKIPPFNTNL